MLFNLQNDPQESTNVAHKAEYKNDVHHLSARLNKFIRQSEAFIPDN
ncbi:hypothetical protein [Glaciecola sp. KUL10]|nr:hypothetical protein [Glaciecola sp. KUL10]GBL05323.1 hypothetical protein KUL10_26430 [Glaciecola sp. KUL10]